MKYLCLAYYDEKKFDALSKIEMEEIGRKCKPYDEALRESGHLVVTGSLQSARSATTIRPRKGKVSITDGPFAETKEQLGGFYLVEAKDLDEAIKLAGGIPAVRTGSIEVRPIMPTPPVE